MKKDDFIEMIKKGEPTYKIIYIGSTDYPNEAYNSYWSLVGADDKFYYIEYSYNHYLYNLNDLTITLYNKISPYTKRQADYSQSVHNLAEILNYIQKTKKEKYSSIGPEQEIFLELNGYNKIKDNKPYTIKRQLKDIAGYREKYILDNLVWIYEEEKDNNYHVLVFEDTEGNYFKINTKDRNRLIVG